MSRREQPRTATGGAKKNRSRYILANTLTSYARDIVDAVTLLILTPFLIRAIGQDGFGLWSLIWAFVGLFALADMGFGTSVVKYVADARGRGDLERLRSVVATLFWVYVALGALVMAGVAGSMVFFNRLFDIPAGQADAARVVLLLIGARSAACLPLGMFRGVLIGYQKASTANGYKVAAAVFYFVVTLVALSLIRDIRLLAVINLVAGVLPMLAMLIHVKRLAPEARLHPRYFDRSLVREVTSFSMYFTLVQISALISTRADALIIKAFLPLEMVAVYAIAMRLAEKGRQFCSHLTKTLTPVIAELHGAGEERNLREVWFRGTKLTVAFATPLLVGLGLLAAPLIETWVGDGFAEAVPALQWLVAASMVIIIHGNTANVLAMRGQHRFLGFTLLGGQLLNLGLSIALIPWLGIAGVAMATFVATLPADAGWIQARGLAMHDCGRWAFYRRTVLPSVAPALIMSVVVLGYLRVRAIGSLVEVALVEGLAVAVFGAAFWLLGLNADERTYLREKVGRRFLPRRRRVRTA